MIHRIDETVPMNELPTWLQELWELDSALARRAEKHYLELKQVKNIAYEPVLGTVDFKAFEAGYKAYRTVSGNTAPYDETAQATCEIEFQKARNEIVMNNR